MKLFDLHADIGYNVMAKRALKETDILTKYHVSKLREGNFSWVCMASYFEGKEDWPYMQQMVLSLKEEIAKCKDIILVEKKEDLYQKEESIHAILTIEGMCGIKENVCESIDWLHAQGIKIASLTWNDENALATGARGSSQRGLSEKGIQAVKRMQEHGMIIDVSHANEKTFWDIMENTTGMVIATHSNARSLCEHVRNLRDEQLIAIAKRGGIIGMVSAGFFVAKQRNEQDIYHLVKHMQYLKDLVGIEHIALGLDFMDDFENSEDDMLVDLYKPSGAQAIVEEMRKQGFQEEEIEAIAYKNALRIIEQAFVYGGKGNAIST